MFPANYLDRLLPSLFDNWWQDAIVDKLSFQQQRRIEQKGIVFLSSLDLAAPAPAESMLTKKNAIYNLPRYSNIMLMKGRLHPENDLDSLLVL